MTPFETRLDLPYTDALHQPGIVIFCTVQNDDTKGLHCSTAKSNIIPGSVILTQFLSRIPNPALKMSYHVTF